jgi:hypothetical protein
MAIEAEIMLALRNRLVAFAQPRTLPIAFNNKSFTPPAARKYLRETFLPNGIASRLLKADRQRLQGLYQIDVIWPSGDGETAALTIASDLAAHFTSDEPLINGAAAVFLTERPALAGLMVEDSQAMIPVTIPWSCWTS